MKKALIALAALAVAACSSEPTSQISGHFDGVEHLSYGFQSPTGTNILDEVSGIENGDFAFDVCDEQGELFLMSKEFPIDFIQIYLAEGEKLVMKGTMDDYTISGTKFYQDWGEYHELVKDIMRETRIALEEYSNAQTEGRESKIDYPKVKVENDEKMDDIALEFIKNHPDSDFSAYRCCYLRKSLFDRGVSMLTERARNGNLKYLIDATSFRYDTDVIAKRARAEAEGKVYVGSKAADFTLKTIDGEDFTLSSLRGRYVMLDFWGSWCHWCVEGMPKVKECVDKYADKLSVVSVDCNDSDEAWRKGVADVGYMTWTQVYNPKTVAVDAQYLVDGYPTFVIIDPEGTIVKIMVGESQNFVEEVGACLK
ncbi:MAG: TlpA family protein disulfide reductase [Bacteroidales bacterium]|nr:TlpA family protein disulfide reductase [Candidatus Cryptobacteroides caccocaballi]